MNTNENPRAAIPIRPDAPRPTKPKTLVDGYQPTNPNAGAVKPAGDLGGRDPASAPFSRPDAAPETHIVLVERGGMTEVHYLTRDELDRFALDGTLPPVAAPRRRGPPNDPAACNVIFITILAAMIVAAAGAIWLGSRLVQ